MKAKDGYALGEVVVRGGGALEGIAFTFLKVRGTGLDPDDGYVSDWYGERSRKPRAAELRAGSDGGPVVGIYGKRFDDRGGDRFDDGGAIGTIGLVLAPPGK